MGIGFVPELSLSLDPNSLPLPKKRETKNGMIANTSTTFIPSYKIRIIIQYHAISEYSYNILQYQNTHTISYSIGIIIQHSTISDQP